MSNFTSETFAATGGTVLRTLPSRLSDIVNVKDYGATGNGSSDDLSAIQSAIDAAFTTAGVPNGDNPGCNANKLLFFPPGHYMISGQLLLNQITGAHIMGSGQSATIIESTTANADVIRAQGVGYTRISGLTLKAFNTTGGYCYHQMVVVRGAIAPQSNTFIDVTFEGGLIGIILGDSTGGNADVAMGSETLFLNCNFNNQSTVGSVDLGGCGIFTAQQNACDQTVINCHFKNCYNAIVGQIFEITGCSFVNSGNWDYALYSSGNGDPIHISNCYSTSTNFANFASFPSCFAVEGVRHDAAANGIFVRNVNTPGIIKNCYSSKGTYKPEFGGNAKIEGCVFGRSDPNWYDASGVANMWFYGNTGIFQLLAGTSPQTLFTGQRRFTADAVTIKTDTYVLV